MSIDLRRRQLLRGRIAQAVGPAADRAAEGPGAPPAPSTLPPPPRPPWALRPDETFRARCTGCGDCIVACPRALLRAGGGGMPTIDFANQGCDLCGACRAACPTGAIEPMAAGGVSSRPAFVERIALAPSCLALHRVECRTCGDACATGALRFVPALGGIHRPQVDAARCTGCGECVAVCPVGATTLRPPA